VNVDGVFITLNSIVIMLLLLAVYIPVKLNNILHPIVVCFKGKNKSKYAIDEEKLTEKEQGKLDHNNIVLRVMADGPPVPPRSPRDGKKKGYANSDSFSYSSRSTRSRSRSRSRSPYSSSGDDEVRRRSRSRSRSQSRTDTRSSRSTVRTDSEAGEGRARRRRSLSLDYRDSGNTTASSEYPANKPSAPRKRSASVSSEESRTSASASASSEFGRKGRTGGRQRSYSSSSQSSNSSSDAELRRGGPSSSGKNMHSDEEPLHPIPNNNKNNKGGKDDANFQDMNIGQLINNIEKLLGSDTEK